MDRGYKEVTVLGQNVNSYRYDDDGTAVSFAELMYRISLVSPELRIRYSTSHPKDCSDELLRVHAERDNVCNYIHLPVQHGNTDVLQRMKRTYTRDQYLALIERARGIRQGSNRPGGTFLQVRIPRPANNLLQGIHGTISIPFGQIEPSEFHMKLRQPA